MRNYVQELHELGKTYSELAQETGLSRKTLSLLARGIKQVKSDSETYNIIRNASRRIAYQKIRESGVSATAAGKYRRIALSPETYQHFSTRHVKHTRLEVTMRQLKMLAEFENKKQKQTAIIECFSYGHKRIRDQQTLIDEAIRDGQSKLGGSNWQLKRIIDLEIIKYQIG